MLLVVGILLVAAACGLGAAILLLQTEPFALDTAWNSLLVHNASEILTVFARVMDRLGGGYVGVLLIPVLGAVGLIILRRPWSAAYFLVAEAASAGAVQVLKHVFGRARPEDILVITDHGSFPSGHVANAATIATAAFVLFPRIWVAIVGLAWLLLMALSRTVLHAHWLSDTLGGALIGIGVALLVAGLFAPLLQREIRDASARRVTRLSA
jgi:undecaprenyl-diphosphatase